jgi:hypothetical protein
VGGADTLRRQLTTSLNSTSKGTVDGTRAAGTIINPVCEGLRFCPCSLRRARAHAKANSTVY